MPSSRTISDSVASPTDDGICPRLCTPSMAPKKVSKSYNDMVIAALSQLKGFQKASRSKIAVFLSTNFGATSKVALKKALQALVKAGTVTTVKGSFKLAPGAKPQPKKKSSKKKAKKASSKKKSPAKKKVSAKKKASAKKVKKTTKKKSPSKKVSSKSKASGKRKSSPKKKTSATSKKKVTSSKKTSKK